MSNEQKAKKICDCDSCKACSKFAEEGAAYAFVSTCDRFDELMQAMQWKEQQMIDKLQKWLAESPPMKNKTVNAFYVNNLLRTMRR